MSDKIVLTRHGEFKTISPKAPKSIKSKHLPSGSGSVIVKIFAFVVIASCCLSMFNEEFTFYGLLTKMGESDNFTSLKKDLALVGEYLQIPIIPVPDIAGFKQIVKCLNGLIEVVNKLDTIVFIGGDFIVRSLTYILELLKYCMGI